MGVIVVLKIAQEDVGEKLHTVWRVVSAQQMTTGVVLVVMAVLGDECPLQASP